MSASHILRLLLGTCPQRPTKLRVGNTHRHNLGSTAARAPRSSSKLPRERRQKSRLQLPSGSVFVEEEFNRLESRPGHPSRISSEARAAAYCPALYACKTERNRRSTPLCVCGWSDFVARHCGVAAYARGGTTKSNSNIQTAVDRAEAINAITSRIFTSTATAERRDSPRSPSTIASTLGRE